MRQVCVWACSAGCMCGRCGTAACGRRALAARDTRTSGASSLQHLPRQTHAFHSIQSRHGRGHPQSSTSAHSRPPDAATRQVQSRAAPGQSAYESKVSTDCWLPRTSSTGVSVCPDSVSSHAMYSRPFTSTRGTGIDTTANLVCLEYFLMRSPVRMKLRVCVRTPSSMSTPRSTSPAYSRSTSSSGMLGSTGTTVALMRNCFIMRSMSTVTCARCACCSSTEPVPGSAMMRSWQWR
mmetsp:Transcript_23208/g.74695  ORF Transcript_23208/g.74695 Transcript_23208/m.74695 type:complete len:236 (-) Transcript_23208:912-1619(-)